MDTQIIITPYGIFIALLVLAGLTALTFLIICLFKLIKLLGKINKFVDTNSAPVTAAIQMLPDITENVATVSSNVAIVTESAGNILDGFTGGGDNTGAGGIIGTVTVIANLIQNIIQVFRNLTGKDE